MSTAITAHAVPAGSPWWRTPAGLLLIAALSSSAVAWWLIALPVLSLGNEAKHSGHFGILFFHALGGTIMLFLGAVNLYIGATRTQFRYHALIGRAYLIGGVLGVAAAVRITASSAHKAASASIFTNTTISLLTLSFAWLAAAAMAYRAVRNRRFDSHRDWMVRSYVLVWAFVFCRLAGRVQSVEDMGGGTAFIWLSWVGPLIVGEIALQWRAGASSLPRARPAGRDVV
jgi:uncharacterized membrane protein YozB (DUF420 family)